MGWFLVFRSCLVSSVFQSSVFISFHTHHQNTAVLLQDGVRRGSGTARMSRAKTLRSKARGGAFPKKQDELALNGAGTLDGEGLIERKITLGAGVPLDDKAGVFFGFEILDDGADGAEVLSGRRIKDFRGALHKEDGQVQQRPLLRAAIGFLNDDEVPLIAAAGFLGHGEGTVGTLFLGSGGGVFGGMAESGFGLGFVQFNGLGLRKNGQGGE